MTFFSAENFADSSNDLWPGVSGGFGGSRLKGLKAEELSCSVFHTSCVLKLSVLHLRIGLGYLRLMLHIFKETNPKGVRLGLDHPPLSLDVDGYMEKDESIQVRSAENSVAPCGTHGLGGQMVRASVRGLHQPMVSAISGYGHHQVGYIHQSRYDVELEWQPL